jgi:hypothetical protein
MTTGETTVSVDSDRFNWKTYAGIALVSAVYFTDVSLRASRKCFWFDELFTTYLCRLHDFKSTWTAVLHGADFNPPLLYLFTRCAQWFFGEGLIATRLPSMIGVWLFGLCLFLFVSRRAGVVSGFIAGALPFFTLAQYYAYEARAHGILLGWCGLTLVCWQRRSDGRANRLWLAGFALCLVGALLTHVYAVYILFPFGLIELYSLLRMRRPDWGIVTALILAFISVTAAVYLPLFRVYRTNVPVTFFAASHDVFQHFLVVVIGPALGVLMILLGLLAFEGLRRPPQEPTQVTIPKREMLLAVAFACVPFVGMLGSKVSHGPFIERYFLSSVAGYAILLGFASSRRLAASWVAKVLAACMFMLMIGDLGTTVYLAVVNRIMLMEPSAAFALSTNPANPMERYELVAADHSGMDILVLRQVKYLYLFKYAPAAVVPRLFFGAPGKDLFLGIYERLAQGAQINLKSTRFAPFLATHDRFLVYGNADPEDAVAIQALASAGYKLKSARMDTSGVLYEYEK